MDTVAKKANISLCGAREDHKLPLTAVRRRSSSEINAGVTILCFGYFMTVWISADIDRLLIDRSIPTVEENKCISLPP